jgi:hypothetical protein
MLAVVALLSFFGGMGVCGCADHDYAEGLKSEAVEAGHAEYHSKTGKWQWKKIEGKCKWAEELK